MLDEVGARSATLAKGLDILNVVAASPAPIRLRQVMAALNLTKPTAHRILSTLVDYGLVRYEASTATYQLGMRLFEMSRRVWQDFDLRGASAAEMRHVAELTGESVALALIVDGSATYVDEIESTHHLRERSRMGQRVPLWRTAIGKALAAGLDYHVRQALLVGTSAEEIALTRFDGIGEISAHLDLVNARGYALELEEHVPGIVGVAAPILDHRGLTVAAIGLTAPADRLSREKLHELGPTLIEATRRASLRAGGAPRPVSSVPRPLTPVSPNVTCIADTRDLIGEGPVWDGANRRLFWVDICRPAIHRLDIASGKTVTFRAGEMVTALALHAEGLLVAAQSGIKIVDPETGDTKGRLGHPEPHVPTNRFNDGKLDSMGRFWVGTMALNLKPGAGCLYRLDPDGSFNTLETGLTLPNGIGWSPDERFMYLTDTVQRTVFRYRYDAQSGAIGERHPLITFPKDRPGADRQYDRQLRKPCLPRKPGTYDHATQERPR
jgi:DNA-binding IclR family transcriptional regulator